MTSVSIVIPCYNYGHFLDAALTSVLHQQAGIDLKALIIDDASTDDSAEVAKRIADADSRVEVSVHDANRGPNATFSEGLLEWADRDYSLLMSADDMLTPGALGRAADLLDTHPSVGFVYGNAVRFTSGMALPNARTVVRGQSVWPAQWWLERRFREVKNFIAPPTVLVRTALQKRAGAYDARLFHSGDMEMWMRLAGYAGHVGFLRGADQAYKRTHARNMSDSFTELTDLRQRRLAYEAVLERHGEKLPDEASLSARVHRELGWEALWTAARAYDRGRTHRTPIDELEAFAFDCWPDARKLLIYHTLQLRKFIGPRLMPYLQPLLLSAVARRADRSRRESSWKFRGI